jgi:DNA-binding NarL/FixJ family response regulator
MVSAALHISSDDHAMLNPVNWDTRHPRGRITINEITILLVDDQPAGRQGLRMRLMLEPDIRILGETGDGMSALELAAALDPDVVVMDVEMPVMDGLAATARLREGRGRCGVVILTIHDDSGTRARALEAGACAFLGKHQAVECLPAAIREAAGPRKHNPSVPSA